MYRLVPFILLTAGIISCSAPMKKGDKSAITYYNLKGVLDEQVDLLKAGTPFLFKEGVVNGEVDKDTLTTDSINWTHELNMLYEADLNKPVYLGLFAESTSTINGRKTLTYSSTSPSKSEVDSLALIFDNDKLIQINAFFSTKNTLFHSAKKLHAQIDNDHLMDWQTSGWQKIPGKDTSKFELNAKILWE